MTFPLFQPKGFRTTPAPRDYDGQRERGPALPAPVLAFQPNYESGIEFRIPEGLADDGAADRVGKR